jgi:hypothetical protein
MLAFGFVAMVVGGFGMNYNTWMAEESAGTSKVRGRWPQRLHEACAGCGPHACPVRFTCSAHLTLRLHGEVPTRPSRNDVTVWFRGLQRHFWMAFVFPCIAAFFMFAAVIVYARWRRLLWIPETV